MTLGIGLSLHRAVNNPDARPADCSLQPEQRGWGPFAGPWTDAQVLAQLDEHKDALAAALGVTGARASNLYPVTFSLWGRWHQNSAGPGGRGFPGDTIMDGLRARGITPTIFWETMVNDASSYTNSHIAAGGQNDFLDAWSSAANAWRENAQATGLTSQCAPRSSRIIVRINQEQNAGWYPWSPGRNGNTVTNWKAMWKTIHDRVRIHNGADHVEFHYCPMAGYPGIAAQYPGDDRCQWAGFDQYDFGGTGGNLRTQFQGAYDAIRSVTSRPMIVGETGSLRIPQTAGSASTNDTVRSNWIKTMPAVVSDLPAIRVVSLFDMWVRPECRSWQMDTPATRLALAQMMDIPEQQDRLR